ncbi:MAG: hypothetical protein J5696_03305 [Lachnospiraceae bacterium]|nr:hypothetical protein [Lachnospiraceae bacterium]
MKRTKLFKLISLSICCVLFFGGCKSEIAEMTDEQQQQVGEYAAFSLLRYDAEHRSRLVDYSEVIAADEAARIAAEEAAAAELARQTETGENDDETLDADGNPVEIIDNTTDTGEGYVSDTMEDFLELQSGLLLSYKGYTIQSSYPEDADVSDYFVVEATSGKKFLVLWYSLYNGSGTSSDINFLSDNISFKCKVNDEVTATALVTMLGDDMSTLQVSLRDNEEIDCVLIFEIDQEVASNLDTIILKLSKPGADWQRKLS